MNVGLGPDIDTLGGLVEDQDLRLLTQPARQDDLLLVAARELRHRVLGLATRLDRQLVEPHAHVCTLGTAAEDAQGHVTARIDEGDVLAQGLVDEGCIRMALCGNQRDATLDRDIGSVLRKHLAIDGDLAAALHAAEDQARNCLTARAGDARHAHDLTAMHGEVHAQDGPARDACELEDLRTVLASCRIAAVVLLELAADDQLDELVLGQALDRAGDDVLAVAKHCHRVGHLEDLVEVVRDEDDRDAGVGHAAHELVEALGLGIGEVRRGLVEDEALDGVAALGHRTGDGDSGALGHLQAGDGNSDVDVVAECLQRLARGVALLAPLDRLGEVGLVPRAHRHVVDGVEVAHEAEVLVHEPQADCLAGDRVLEVQGLPADGHLGAWLRGMEAGEDLDEGRLAAAVLAHERAHLARVHVDADVVERNLGAEDLRRIAHRYSGRHYASLSIARTLPRGGQIYGLPSTFPGSRYSVVTAAPGP